ncbi:LamG-like jellyroll fold domain-containing protein [Luteibaculum oceani]|uniref:T9SS type A sorting domain-containing protein n=1 Tax=Luteibaculum oceani TaxID=1294296 RepID=A0A5C6V2C6_9FLAO|nr:LamG-like jellyroll fold domain-containing protein [Luteibaculum oceani]TXC78616.1 T9SS type A sorting domain-containing protein [Luteibaculum oceani]
MRTTFILLFCIMQSIMFAQQDTIVVQTFTFDSTSRRAEFTFPDNDPNSYEKVLMHYRMRCRNGEVNTTGGNNVACGEWDYSCNTYITDSTQFDSLKATHPTHIVSGFSGSALSYNTTPSYDLIQRVLTQTTYTNVNSESEYGLNLGPDTVLVVSPDQTAHRFQVLYTAAELSSTGMGAGNITGIQIPLQGTGLLKNLKIKVKSTSLTEINQLETQGFQTVFYNHLALDQGLGFAKFSTPFNWNGQSDLLLEISFDYNGSFGTPWLGANNTSKRAIARLSNGTPEFNGSGYLKLEEADLLGISDEISVGFWMKGDINALGTLNSSAFEGVDGSNRRQVNSHLPWSNSNVYWDCGNDGSGYDRVNQNVEATTYTETWNHWFFTKNARTGIMGIYHNGSLVKQNTGKNKLIDLVKLAIGSSYPNAAGNTNPFYGALDNFTIYNKRLSTAEIAAHMNGDLSVLDNLDGNVVFDLNSFADGGVDEGPLNISVSEVDDVTVTKVFGDQLDKGFKRIGVPNIGWVQGDYTLSNTQVTVYDTIYHAGKLVKEYEIVDNQPVVANQYFAWTRDLGLIYDDAGEVIDGFDISLENNLNIGVLDYFRKSPAKFEIMSFVTPYGINLDLGMEGKMWEFDVTDFAPVLRGKKVVSLERGGQNQEEMDIKFIFIKGTPERNIISLKQLWPVNQTSYGNIAADNQYQPLDVPISADAKYGKIRSVITGHGQEGEFISRQHYVDINAGQKRFSWNAWTECSENPIYPQGGTWLNDRAGWCPGAPSDINEFDVSQYLSPGSILQVDYGMASATGDSRYIVNHQLVTYGDYNFSTDAAIEYVIKPSQRTEFDRFNMACTQPEVLIKNKGGDVISSLELQYWVNPNNKKTYTWSGSIQPSAYQKVNLPIEELDFWTDQDAENVFYVEVTAVNGGADQYAPNNSYRSPYTPVPVYEKGLTLNYRTNTRGWESSYRILDMAGNVVTQKSGFTSNTTYSDDLELPNGCFRLEFMDDGDDGLYYWYYAAIGQDRGRGFLRLKNGFGTTIKAFEEEFGGTVTHEFINAGAVGISKQTREFAVNVYPNPTEDGIINVYNGGGLESGDHILVRDASGRIVFNLELGSIEKVLQLDLGSLNTGVYFMDFNRNGVSLTIKKISVL